MKIIEWLYCSIFKFFDIITLYHPQRDESVKLLSIMYLSFFLSHTLVALFYYINPHSTIIYPSLIVLLFLLFLSISWYLLLFKQKHDIIISRFNSLSKRKRILIYSIVIMANILVFFLYKEGPYTQIVS